MNGMALTRQAKVAEFLNSPLVKWVRTFEELAPCDSVSALADSELLNRIMQEVDPTSVSLAKVNKKVNGDRMRRAQNLHYILEGIQNYFAVTLEQVIIMRLPDLLAICKDAENDDSLYEMEKMLLLLLGCSVQCENKEIMIQQIQRLETGVQHAVVSHIKEVTDNPDNVYAFEWEDIEAMSKAQLEAECRRMYLYLQKLAKERDEYHLARIDLAHERDFYMEQFSMVANVKRTPSRTPSFLRSPPDVSELETQQITDLKRKMRHQQEQLDAKVVQLQEVQEELEKYKDQVHRLHNEKRQLSKDAQKVRVYKDEVELLRAKANEVDQLQAENKKLRDMVEDVDYLKKKVQDLKEQNLLVQESKQLLEEELSSMSLKQNQLAEKNAEIAKLKVQIDALQAAKDADLQQIQELIESSARLEFDKTHGEEEIAFLTRELEDLKGQLAVRNGEDLKTSMENEVDEAELSARMKLLRLERDNQHLEKMMEDLKQATARMAALEVKNKELQQKSQEDRSHRLSVQEELTVEQLKSQQLQEDRSKLQMELERHGVDTEEQLSGMKMKEKQKFAKLEARLDAALNRSVGFDEERITVLESRLEEAGQTNQGLSQALDGLRQENLRLKASTSLALQSTDMSSGSGHGNVSPTDSGSSGGYSHEASPSTDRRWETNYLPDRTESPQMRHSRISDHSRHSHSSPYMVHVKEGISPRDFVHLQDRILDLRGEKSALELETADLKSRLNRLEQEKGEIELRRKTEGATKDADIRSLQRQLQDLEVFRVEVEIRRNEVNQLNRELSQCRRRLQEAESLKAELEIHQHSMSSAKLAEAKSLKRQLDEVLSINHELQNAQDTLVEKCSMLDQMNKTLEQENRHLLTQLSSLVVQNRDLMTQNIDSKDRFHVEEKQFQEKLNEMENEKRRLGGKLEQLEAERNKKKKGFFRRMKGKLKGGKTAGSKTDGFSFGSSNLPPDFQAGGMSLSESNPSLSRQGGSFTGLPDVSHGPQQVGSQPGMRASISYGPSEQSTRIASDGYLSPPVDAPRSRYSIATATPSDRSRHVDTMVSMDDFLRESDRTPRSRKRYVEEALNGLETSFRERGVTLASSAPVSELVPRRDMYPGESPPSFLQSPKRKATDPGTYGSNRGRTSPLGRLPRETSADALLSGLRRSPKARRRMQSTDALLGARVLSPPLQENNELIYEEESPEKSRTLPRRRQKTTEAMLGLEELHSPGLRRSTSQERLPSDGAPSEETDLKSDMSAVHRSQARATLVVMQPSTRPAAQGANNGDVRKASASSDADSGFGPPAQHSPGKPRFQSPVGEEMKLPVYQSTPMRPPQQGEVRSSSEEEALTNASSGVDLAASNSSSNRSIVERVSVQPPTSPTNKTGNETGMDASGWYEYGCV